MHIEKTTSIGLDFFSLRDLLIIYRTCTKFEKINIHTHQTSVLSFPFIKLFKKIRVYEFAKGSFLDKALNKKSIGPFSTEDINRYSFYCVNQVLSFIDYKDCNKKRSYLENFIRTYAVYSLSHSFFNLIYLMAIVSHAPGRNNTVFIDNSFFNKLLVKELMKNELLNLDFRTVKNDGVFVIFEKLLTSYFLRLKNVFRNNPNKLNIPQLDIPSNLTKKIFSFIENKNTSSKKQSKYVCFPLFDGFYKNLRSELDSIQEFNGKSDIKVVLHSRQITSEERKSISLNENISHLKSSKSFLRNPLNALISFFYSNFLLKKIQNKCNFKHPIYIYALKEFKKNCKYSTTDWYRYFKREKIAVIVVGDYMDEVFSKVFAIELLNGLSIYNDRTTAYSFPDYTYIAPSHIRIVKDKYEELLIPYHQSSNIFIKAHTDVKPSNVSNFLSDLILKKYKDKLIIGVFDENIEADTYNDFYNALISIVQNRKDIVLLIKPKKQERLLNADRNIINQIKTKFSNQIKVLSSSIKASDVIHVSHAVITLPSTVYFDSVRMDKPCFLYDKHGVVENYLNYHKFNFINIYNNLSHLINNLSNPKIFNISNLRTINPFSYEDKFVNLSQIIIYLNFLISKKMTNIEMLNEVANKEYIRSIVTFTNNVRGYGVYLDNE